MIHDMIADIKNNFKDKVKIVGAPFEADHQLAALFRQGIVDYVQTTDSDLNVLGTDTISLPMKGKQSKCWLMHNSELLKERLPTQFHTENIEWTDEILAHVGCFLGNDFLDRNPGNGPGKVSAFVKNIVRGPGDNRVKDEEELCEYILNEVLVPTHATSEIKEKWTPALKLKHLKTWKESFEMFMNGPAFLVHSTDPQLSIREAFFQDKYEISVGSLRGGDGYWNLQEQSASDLQCNRTLRVGFHPF